MKAIRLSKGYHDKLILFPRACAWFMNAAQKFQHSIVFTDSEKWYESEFRNSSQSFIKFEKNRAFKHKTDYN